MIAGLIPPDAGEILFDGKPLRAIKFGYVFQNYREALFPWLRVGRQHRISAQADEDAARPSGARGSRSSSPISASRSTSTAIPTRCPAASSSLVSIMRALVVEPEILFLDEPFSALDYEMTLFMREQLQRIFIETGTTTVLVSHDLEEAVYLADRILLLSRGPAQIADYARFEAPRPAHRRDAVRSGFRRDQGALPRSVPARGAQGMKRDPRSFPAGARRDRADRAVVRRGLEADRRSGAAAVADRHVPRHVQGHGRRPARLSTS